MQSVAEKVLILCKNNSMKGKQTEMGSFFLFLVLLSSTFFFPTACAREETPLELFQRELELAATDLEKGSVTRLADLLHAEFMDQDGRSAAELMDWTQDLLERRRGVVIHLLDVDEKAAPSVERPGRVEIDLVVSSGGLKLVRKLVSFYGRLVRLRLEVEGGSFWKVSSAEWEEIEMADLGVKALDAFKTLFPDPEKNG